MNEEVEFLEGLWYIDFYTLFWNLQKPSPLCSRFLWMVQLFWPRRWSSRWTHVERSELPIKPSPPMRHAAVLGERANAWQVWIGKLSYCSKLLEFDTQKCKIFQISHCHVVTGHYSKILFADNSGIISFDVRWSPMVIPEKHWWELLLNGTIQCGLGKFHAPRPVGPECIYLPVQSVTAVEVLIYENRLSYDLREFMESSLLAIWAYFVCMRVTSIENPCIIFPSAA